MHAAARGKGAEPAWPGTCKACVSTSCASFTLLAVRKRARVVRCRHTRRNVIAQPLRAGTLMRGAMCVCPVAMHQRTRSRARPTSEQWRRSSAEPLLERRSRRGVGWHNRHTHTQTLARTTHTHCTRTRHTELLAPVEQQQPSDTLLRLKNGLSRHKCGLPNGRKRERPK